MNDAYASCPACGAQSFSTAFEAVEMFDRAPFAVSRCTQCGVHRTDPDLSDEQLASYYHYEGGADAGARFAGPLEPLMRALRRARVKQVTGGRAPGRALDVGCGRGELLAALKESGWDVSGTEIDDRVAATARSRFGNRIYIGTLTSIDFGAQPFDVISLWHVLEHLRDPFGELCRARELLAPDGQVVVGIPNFASWQARLGGDRWLHLDVPRHRWHFSEDNLRQLAQRAGLRVDGVEHFSLEYGPYGVLQSGLSRVGLKHTLFTDILRPGRRDRWLRSPQVWAHAVLAAPIALAGALAVPIELAAAGAGAGGGNRRAAIA